MLSPLYRLRKIKEEEIAEDDQKLLELSKIVSGDEEKAAKIWENWGSQDSLAWEKVQEVYELHD